jgi:hypothetical protein
VQRDVPRRETVKIVCKDRGRHERTANASCFCLRPPTQIMALSLAKNKETILFTYKNYAMPG